MLAVQGQPDSREIEIRVAAHRQIRGRCSRCQKQAPGYDRLPRRRWLFVPLWGIPTYFCYAPRRVECPEHGIIVEHIPWSDGKRPVTCAMMGFLARWGRRLSWRETAQAFQTSWEAVYWRKNLKAHSVGGMVCGVGSGSPGTARSRIHRRG